MIEVEKKFRLTKRQRDAVLKRLPEVGANLEGEDFEENTLYNGAVLNDGSCILRLRRVEGKATLTYKKRIPTNSAIKQRREEETAVGDPEAMFTEPGVSESTRATNASATSATCRKSRTCMPCEHRASSSRRSERITDATRRFGCS